MNELAALLRLTELELKNYVYNFLTNFGMNPIYGKSYVYSKGEIPIMLVAHMDTVFEYTAHDLYYDKEEDVIFSASGGIGGDDRCGVYAILRILSETNFRPYILFTQGEEIGGIGATDAVTELEKPDVKYILEFDRAGENDCVFYGCDNKKFINYVQQFGFEEQIGSFSDISILGPVWDIATVNVSSGYYNEHTKNEYIVFHQLENSINKVINMIKSLQDSEYFDYQKKKYNRPFYDDYLFYECLSKEEKKKKLRKDKNNE